MAKSALLKSSIVKKYWMALTGLFLCLFLAGHLAGNLQLVFGTSQDFNEYALFMTTNPAVKILSYLTYISILFHAIDGILLTFQNKAARPIGYAKTDGSSSSFASRNMAVLGTIILVFIVTHMVNFWAKMHFDESMPLQETVVESPMGELTLYNTVNGSYVNKEAVEVRNVTDFYDPQLNLKVGQGYKDLHKITFEFFKDEKFGLIFTLGYVLAMLAMAFHLWHGFQSAFQSLGATGSKLTPAIKLFGKLFSVIVPLLFAIIPIYIHFSK
jgi:succinate dehydrogenase / fumarate reductase, cytochrome b subunit